MSAAVRVLLVSPDLMAASRLAGLCREAGGSLETAPSLAGQPPGGPYELVLIDLAAEDPAVAVPRARSLLATDGEAGGSAAAVVAFGPHVARERLAAAHAAGADDVVSRGELMGGFAALFRKWRAGKEREGGRAASAP